jgi:hypothetical protein
MCRLAIVGRYCDNDRIYEELCCLIPLGATAKGQNIITAFLSYFENQNTNINKIFCVTTDAAPAMAERTKDLLSIFWIILYVKC